MKTLFSMALALACGTALTAHAEVKLSGNAALTTDYVWRGSSQTRGEAALQLGARADLPGGFYASAWVSNVDFSVKETGRDAEVDYTVGWTGKLRDALSLDVNALHYRYPGQQSSINWTEGNATLTLKERYWLQVGHSGNAMATQQRGTYALLGARLPLSPAFRIEIAGGHYSVQSQRAYTHGYISGLYKIPQSPLELRASWHTTDVQAKERFPGQAGGRAEFALQAAF